MLLNQLVLTLLLQAFDPNELLSTSPYRSIFEENQLSPNLRFYTTTVVKLISIFF